MICPGVKTEKKMVDWGLWVAAHKGRALTSSRCPSSVRAYPWRRAGFKLRYSATLEIREMEALITGTNTRVMWERQSRTREVQAGRGVKMETAVEEDGRCPCRWGSRIARLCCVCYSRPSRRPVEPRSRSVYGLMLSANSFDARACCFGSFKKHPKSLDAKRWHSIERSIATQRPPFWSESSVVMTWSD